jgi:alpha-galactosidase
MIFRNTLYRAAILAVWTIAALAPIAPAQTSIRFLEKAKLFLLDDGKMTYAFGINEQNALQHVYWGKHVARDADFSAVHSSDEWASFDLGTTRTPQEYPGWGAGLYVEPSLKITFRCYRWSTSASQYLCL